MTIYRKGTESSPGGKSLSLYVFIFVHNLCHLQSCQRTSPLQSFATKMYVAARVTQLFEQIKTFKTSSEHPSLQSQEALTPGDLFPPSPPVHRFSRTLPCSPPVDLRSKLQFSLCSDALWGPDQLNVSAGYWVGLALQVSGLVSLISTASLFFWATALHNSINSGLIGTQFHQISSEQNPHFKESVAGRQGD